MKSRSVRSIIFWGNVNAGVLTTEQHVRVMEGEIKVGRNTEREAISERKSGRLKEQ